MEIAKGNKLFPMQMAFFLRGADALDLRRKNNTLNSLLLANGIQPIREGEDLLVADSYPDFSDSARCFANYSSRYNASI